MHSSRQCRICQQPLEAKAEGELCERCRTVAEDEGTPTLKIPTSYIAVAEKPGLPQAACAIPPEPRLTQAAGLELPDFGDYRILNQIAHGGMGVVYRARQIKLNRTVAIKMLLAGLHASEKDIQRFKIEAEAAANLQHPNIVAIHEVGECQGRHYFTMDYVEGQSLHEVLQAERLPLARAAALLKTIAEAVHYAHQRGILHRDLKPSNVLIDAAGVPRLTDFGLARRLESQSDLTLSGTAVGTPAYMAPEQAMGKKTSLGPACDIYSLGAILYEMLTGRPPFLAENPVELLLQAQRDEPALPSRLNPQVPPDLETICLKCLEKNPGSRYFSALELAEELGRFLEREPIKARPAGPLRRAWHWCQRNPWVITGGLSVLLLSLFGLTYGLWQKVQYLEWKSVSGSALPAQMVYLVSSAAVAAPLIYLLLGVGMLPLAHYRTSKLRRESIRGDVLRFYTVFGLLQIVAGLYFTSGWIEAYVWGTPHRWKFPQMGLLPALSLFWFGTLVIWIAVREHYRNLFGTEIAGEPEPTQVVRISLKRTFVAMLAGWAGIGLLAVFWLSEYMLWRVTFAALAVVTMLLPFSLALWRCSRGVLRYFWLFTTLNLLVFSVEFFARLQTNLQQAGLRWIGLMVGLALGAIWVATARIRPAKPALVLGQPADSSG